MPSLYVGHNGHCSDEKIQHSVIHRVSEIARLADALRPDHARHRVYAAKRFREIVAVRGLFPDACGVPVGENYVRLRKVRLDGVAFTVPTNLGLHAGEHYFHLVFASVTGEPRAQGVLVGVAEPEDRRLRAAPCAIVSLGAQPRLHAEAPAMDDRPILEPATIKMRGGGIDWLLALLGFLKRYCLLDLDYAGWERLQGWSPYLEIDPADVETRERLWTGLKHTLVSEFAQLWFEPVVDPELLLQTKALDAAWLVRNFAPSRVVLNVSRRVEIEVGHDRATLTALAGAARAAIVGAGVAFGLESLGFGFRGHELVLSSRIAANGTGHERRLVVSVDIAPAGLSRRAVVARP